MPRAFAGPLRSVLVVEDDSTMLMMLAEELRDAGFDVREAESGDAALRTLSASAPVDLLLTDVRMPGLVDGLGLARRVRSEWPGTKIVLMSGYLRDMENAGVADAFLGKPFPLAAAADCVERLLSGIPAGDQSITPQPGKDCA